MLLGKYDVDKLGVIVLPENWVRRGGKKKINLAEYRRLVLMVSRSLLACFAYAGCVRC